MFQKTKVFTYQDLGYTVKHYTVYSITYTIKYSLSFLCPATVLFRIQYLIIDLFAIKIILSSLKVLQPLIRSLPYRREMQDLAMVVFEGQDMKMYEGVDIQ